MNVDEPGRNQRNGQRQTRHLRHVGDPHGHQRVTVARGVFNGVGQIVEIPSQLPGRMTGDLARGVRRLEGRTQSGGVPHANDNDSTCPDPDYR